MFTLSFCALPMRRLAVIAWVALGALDVLFAAPEPVRVIVGEEVELAGVKRFGMNLTDTWWDAGAVTNDRAVYNFEGTQYRSIFWGPRQDAGGIYVWQAVTAPPEDYQASSRVIGADFTILNGPAKGMTGKIVEVRRERLPEQDDRELDYLVFDHEVPAGDSANVAVMVERDGTGEGHFNVVGSARAGSRHWLSEGAELIAGDVALESFGSHALRLDGSEVTAHIRLPGKNAEVTTVRGAWSLKFRAKAVGGSPVIRVREPGAAEFTPGKDWGEFAVEFTVPEDFTNGNLTALIEVDGGAVLVDDLVFSHEEFAGATAFGRLLVDELKQLRPGFLRYLQMGGSSMENMLRPRLEQARFSSSPWTSTGPRGGGQQYPFSLHEFYQLCAVVDADPWYCLPGVIHPVEVEQFMEYLAAPADTGMGHLRATQGQARPWTEVFDEIIVEFGNEAWNSWGPFQAGGYNGPGYWESLIAAGKASPYYNEKVKFTIAGQNVNTWLNRRVVEATPEADVFAVATYLLHGLDPEQEERLTDSPEALYSWLWGEAQYRLSVKDAMQTNADLARDHGMELAVYEVNHHAASGEASSAFRNRFLTSLGGGLNVAQNLLLMLQEYHARIQCFFTLFGETNNAYQVKDVRLFGSLITLKEGEVRRRPQYLALMAVNRVLGGDLLAVSFPDGVPQFESAVYDEKAHAWQEAQTFSTLRALAFADGRKRSLILLNLSVDEKVPVKVEFSGEVRGGIATWTLLSADSVDANNERETGEPQVALREGSMQDFVSGRVLPLPPASLTTLSWEQ